MKKRRKQQKGTLYPMLISKSSQVIEKFATQLKEIWTTKYKANNKTTWQIKLNQNVEKKNDYDKKYK